MPLFTIEDIKDFKNNKFIEIPERFNTESWIYAFQENPMIYGIIKSQFSFNYFEKLIFSRKYESASINLNSDISNKEKLLSRKMVKKISSAILESLITGG